MVTGSTNGNNSIGVTIGEQGGNVKVEILGSGPVTKNNPNSSSNIPQNTNGSNKNTVPDSTKNISFQNITNNNSSNNTNVVNNGINDSDTYGPADNLNNNGISTAAVVNGNINQNDNRNQSNNSDNPNKSSSGNLKHWSLVTALENGWDRFWGDLSGSSNANDNDW